MWITGKGERYARNVLRKIRLLHAKDRHQAVTIAEVSAYLKIPEKDIFNVINRIKPDFTARSSEWPSA